MTTYTWEPIPEGETPEWGEWIKLENWDDEDVEQFVGVNPANGNWVSSCGKGYVSQLADGTWLRRVEKPHRWDRWVTFAMADGWMSMYGGKPNDWDTGGPRALVHIYCDADGELHIEQAND